MYETYERYEMYDMYKMYENATKCYKNATQLKFGDIQKRYKRYVQERRAKPRHQTLVVAPLIQTLKIKSPTCLTEA